MFTGVGTLVLGLIVYAAWISPEGSHLAKLQAEQTAAPGAADGSSGHGSPPRRGRRRSWAPTASSSRRTSPRFPGTPDVDSFLQQVTALAVASGDPNTPSISVTQATGRAKGGVTPVAVAMTLEGTYGQMTSFLSGLDTFPRLFTVTSISVTGGPLVSGGRTVAPATAGYTLTMSGDIFYSTGQKNVCASGATSA